jgi:transposase
MLAFPLGLKIYLAVEPVDMRKHFNGLWALATEKLKEDPRLGAVFVFGNKDRDRVKLLYWDGTGIWILAKRLEKGRFSWPVGSDRTKLMMTPEAMTMLLGGIDLKEGCQKAWFERQSACQQSYPYYGYSPCLPQKSSFRKTAPLRRKTRR